ncbi:MAG TPA: FmdB family zinc ribbon protein [Pseudonocardiaceae bacterium]|nr:FmdB family zinc ribbon protein [Pseudonocardiaceae bacterium]
MPTYQYACTACGHRFEAVQSFTDASLSECPECSGKLRKLFGSVGVVFKGSGFYRNDSRADAKKPAAAESKPAESKPAESKPSEKSTSSSNDMKSTSTTAKAS